MPKSSPSSRTPRASCAMPSPRSHRKRSNENTESFLQLARTSLGEFQRSATTDLEVRQKAIDLLVQPLRESLKNVDTKLNEVERGRASSQAQLSEQLRSLSQSQQVLHSETTKLARALRSPNIRGQWGEIQLRRILESAGLLETIHFDFKESTQTEEGRLSPDVIIKLPGGKNVVVDAKVPLAAYLDAMEGGRGTSSRRETEGPRAAAEGTRQSARRQELLGPLPARTRHRRDVRTRRGAALLGHAARSGAARVQHGQRDHARQPAVA